MTRTGYAIAGDTASPGHLEGCRRATSPVRSSAGQAYRAELFSTTRRNGGSRRYRRGYEPRKTRIIGRRRNAEQWHGGGAVVVLLRRATQGSGLGKAARRPH